MWVLGCVCVGICCMCLCVVYVGGVLCVACVLVCIIYVIKCWQVGVCGCAWCMCVRLCGSVAGSRLVSMFAIPSDPASCGCRNVPSSHNLVYVIINRKNEYFGQNMRERPWVVFIYHPLTSPEEFPVFFSL